MRPKSLSYTPSDDNLTVFASNVTGATWTLSATTVGDGLAHKVTIRNDSITDHSAKTAVLVGTDADGRALTETLNLPGTSATVTSTKYFKTLTSVTPSATINADTMDIGWSDVCITPSYPINTPQLARGGPAAVRARRPKRLPVVLSREEARRLMAELEGPPGLVARLLYGSGLRLLEALRLRVAEVELDRREILVRAGKGDKDRRTTLAVAALGELREQLARAREVWRRDREAGVAGVELPHALAAKYPRAGEKWGWQWVFPAPALSVDPRSGIRRRHHLHESRVQRDVRRALRAAGIAKAP